MTLDTLDPKIQKLAETHVKYIRRMATLTDDEIKMVIFKQLIEHPHLVEKHSQEEEKKMFSEITASAKDIHSSPLKFARKIDSGISLL